MMTSSAPKSRSSSSIAPIASGSPTSPLATKPCCIAQASDASSRTCACSRSRSTSPAQWWTRDAITGESTSSSTATPGSGCSCRRSSSPVSVLSATTRTWRLPGAGPWRCGPLAASRNACSTVSRPDSSNTNPAAQPAANTTTPYGGEDSTPTMIETPSNNPSAAATRNASVSVLKGMRMTNGLSLPPAVNACQGGHESKPACCGHLPGLGRKMLEGSSISAIVLTHAQGWRSRSRPRRRTSLSAPTDSARSHACCLGTRRTSTSCRGGRSWPPVGSGLVRDGASICPPRRSPGASAAQPPRE